METHKGLHNMIYEISENSILLDITSNEDIRDYDTLDSLKEHLMGIINETEMTYYDKAIDYLKENDASLNYSLSLASEQGFELTTLNSEILATLLYQNELLEALETDIHKIRYAIIATLLLPHNGMYHIEIDDKGNDACDNDGFEGFETLEEAQSALEWIKEGKFENYLDFEIKKVTIED